MRKTKSTPLRQHCERLDFAFLAKSNAWQSKTLSFAILSFHKNRSISQSNTPLPSLRAKHKTCVVIQHFIVFTSKALPCVAIHSVIKAK
ncbi:hypothetical protein [Helicobacter sp. T3_23-1056]